MKKSTKVRDATPVPPHLASEFYAWLWWRSQRDGRFDLGDEVGRVELWIEDRLSFRLPADDKASAVLTGPDLSQALEARAALLGGKVVHDVRIALRRGDREFSVTLKGPAMDLVRLEVPQATGGTGEEALYDRVFLYEEVSFVLAALWRAFAAERTSRRWKTETLPELRAWAAIP